MTVTESIYYICPNCFTIIGGLRYLSEYMPYSDLYSDTYIASTMKIPEGSEYVGCPDCKNIFNSESCETFNTEEYENNRQIVFKKFTEATRPDRLPALDKEEYKTLLDEVNDVNAKQPLSHFKTTKLLLQKNERREHLLWYLWSFNHEITKKGMQKEIDNGDYKKYTDELIAILDSETDKPDSQILSIEIFRERGEFEEASKRYAKIDINSLKIFLKNTAIEMKRYIDSRDSAIFKIEYDDTWLA